MILICVISLLKKKNQPRGHSRLNKYFHSTNLESVGVGFS